MKKYNITLGAITALTLIPSVAFAAKDLRSIVTLLVSYFNLGVYLIMSLAILFFVWNVFVYFFKSDGGESKAEAGKYVMYGVIGFFVMISFWGMVNILDRTFNLDSQSPANGIDVHGEGARTDSAIFNSNGGDVRDIRDLPNAPSNTNNPFAPNDTLPS